MPTTWSKHLLQYLHSRVLFQHTQLQHDSWLQQLALAIRTSITHMTCGNAGYRWLSITEQMSEMRRVQLILVRSAASDGLRQQVQRRSRERTACAKWCLLQVVAGSVSGNSARTRLPAEPRRAAVSRAGHVSACPPGRHWRINRTPLLHTQGTDWLQLTTSRALLAPPAFSGSCDSIPL